MKRVRTSVIVAFYNKIDYLRLVLASLECQSFSDFEVIVADDGSRENVVEELRQLVEASPLRIHHVWHEDRGWRKNEIMNAAVRRSQSDYLIVVDGDCVCHSRFVEEHWNNRQSQVCLTGRRVNLSASLTAQITPQNVKGGFLEKSLTLLIKDGLFGKTTDVERAPYIPAGWLRKWLNRKPKGLLGCNYSIYKADLMAINGFDERYRSTAWGEDSDVQFRLELIGVRIQTLINAAVQYHLYHKPLERPSEGARLFAEVQATRQAYTPYGINQ